MKKKLDLPLLITLVILAFFVFVPMISAFEYSIRTPLEGGYGFKHYQWAVAEEEFLLLELFSDDRRLLLFFSPQSRSYS